MKQSSTFFLASVFMTAPHTTPVIAVSCGVIYLICGAIALLLELLHLSKEVPHDDL